MTRASGPNAPAAGELTFKYPLLQRVLAACSIPGFVAVGLLLGRGEASKGLLLAYCAAALICFAGCLQVLSYRLTLFDDRVAVRGLTGKRITRDLKDIAHIEIMASEKTVIEFSGRPPHRTFAALLDIVLDQSNLSEHVFSVPNTVLSSQRLTEIIRARAHSEIG